MASSAESIANTRKLLNEAIKDDLYIAYVIRSNDGNPSPHVYAGPIEELKDYYYNSRSNTPILVPEDFIKVELAHTFNAEILELPTIGGTAKFVYAKIWALWSNYGGGDFRCTLFSNKPTPGEYRNYIPEIPPQFNYNPPPINPALDDEEYFISGELEYWLLPARLLRKRIAFPND